jgi:hypothetical protein
MTPVAQDVYNIMKADREHVWWAPNQVAEELRKQERSRGRRPTRASPGVKEVEAAMAELEKLGDAERKDRAYRFIG